MTLVEQKISFKMIPHNDCYDLIGQILKKLYFFEGTIGGTHRNKEIPNYVVFIDI